MNGKGVIQKRIVSGMEVSEGTRMGGKYAHAIAHS